jgi:hypothetical protein
LKNSNVRKVFVAGGLGKDEEGVFRVEYEDEMDGVEVAEAIADGIQIADLPADEGCTTLKELIPYNGVLNVKGLHRPLLAMKVINVHFEFHANPCFVFFPFTISTKLFYVNWVKNGIVCPVETIPSDIALGSTCFEAQPCMHESHPSPTGKG